ncbi:hypothetical protein GQ42DRAFT_143119, partial [Ramicandelaber brevisporus]
MSDSVQKQLQHLVQLSDDADVLEQLGPVLTSLHRNKRTDLFRDHLDTFISRKEGEIERLCSAHSQEFLEAMGQLMRVREVAGEMQQRLVALNKELQATGKVLYEQKYNLLQLKRTQRNVSGAIDTVKLCLTVVTQANNIQAHIQKRNYHSALRAIDEVRSTYLPQVEQYAFAQHMRESIPMLEDELIQAVSADVKEWLFRLRETSRDTGKRAIDKMQNRQLVWKERMDKLNATTGGSRRYVSTAVQFALDEELDDNLTGLDIVDLKPLHQCLHIYDKLGRRAEFKTTYADDRKAQANLILATNVDLSQSSNSSNSSNSASPLNALVHDIIGFFLIEYVVLTTIPDFRSRAEVDSLWNLVMSGLSTTVAKNIVALRTNQQMATSLKRILDAFTHIME